MTAPVHIGLLLFPKLTPLDLVGPLQVFARIPGAIVHLVWKRLETVSSDTVLAMPATITFDDCPQLDVICVPGGLGVDDMMLDDEVLDFLRRQAAAARYVTSVCTGALVLGAAGLLEGYRAATHWSAMDNLTAFGATPTATRVCRDRNRITGGGITAGIDFALTLAEILSGRAAAEAIQLLLEYNPAPPFTAGSPQTARPETVAMIARKIAEAHQGGNDAVARAAAALAQRRVATA